MNIRRNVDRFPAILARAVRFTILTTNGSEPCLDELEVYTTDEPGKNIALGAAAICLFRLCR